MASIERFQNAIGRAAGGGVPMQLRVRLSLMMFLQSFVFASWYVTGPNYLGTIGFQPTDFGWMYSVGPIAGLISPLFVGLIADRYFPAQRVLGAVNLFGAVTMFLATLLMQRPGVSPSAVNAMFFLHMLALYPTFALVVTLPMRHLDDPQRSFPGIRVFATIGWICAGWVLSWIGWEKSVAMFYLTSAGAAVNGLYCLTLPHTPPMQRGQALGWRQIVGADALVLLRDRSYLTFLVCSTLVCIPLAFYQQIASRVVEMIGLPIGQTMSYGQMSEMVFMIIMPVFFVRLGVKWMLAAGMLAWVVRYTLLGVGASSGVSWMILLAIVLHGMCFDFFFVTGQIYTDRRAPAAIRGQAQSLLVLFTLGLGMGIGAQLGGHIEQHYTPAASARLGVQVQNAERGIAALTDQAAHASGAAKARLMAAAERARQQQAVLRHRELEAKEWKMIFLLPAAFAALILVVFVAMFRAPRGRLEPIGEVHAAPMPDPMPDPFRVGEPG